MTNEYKKIAEKFTPYPPQNFAELAWRLEKQGYPQPKKLQNGQTWYNLGECRIEIKWLWGALFRVMYDAHGKILLPRRKLQTTTPGNAVAFLPPIKELKKWVSLKK